MSFCRSLTRHAHHYRPRTSIQNLASPKPWTPISARAQASLAPGSSSTPDTLNPILSGPTSGELMFYKPPSDGSIGWYYPDPVPGGKSAKKFNYITDHHTVELADIRGRESEFNIDDHGFAAVTIPSPSGSSAEEIPKVDFNSDASIQNSYYPQLEHLLLDHLGPHGARQVSIFDHTIRRGTSPNHPRRPVPRIHVDASPASAVDRVKRHMFAHGGTAIDAHLSRRFQVINIWRPINGRVETWPLCFADSRSVPDAKLQVTEHRYETRTGEVLLMEHEEQAKWYYWSGMGKAEREWLLLLQFDSERMGTRTPHGAFSHPGEKQTEGEKGRDSIEVGALVFY